jgi:hypothetical protein
MRVSVFGHLGLATMCAATLRNALELAIEFASLGSTAEGMRLQVEGEVASLILDEYVDFGSVRDVVTYARLIGLWRIAQALTGRDVNVSVDIAFPEPPYHRRFAHAVPAVRYGQPTTRALMKTEVLSYPLVLADPVATRFAIEQCTKQLTALAAGGRLVRKVRSVLWKPDGSLRSSQEVARVTDMSTRTLRRKLTLQGRTLSSLVDEERRDSCACPTSRRSRSPSGSGIATFRTSNAHSVDGRALRRRPIGGRERQLAAARVRVPRRARPRSRIVDP